MTDDFFSKITKEIVEGLRNDYSDNLDAYRFGKVEPARHWLKGPVKDFLYRKGFVSHGEISQALSFAEPNFSDLSALHDWLGDDESKELLAKVIAYRALGHRRVKLPLNNQRYWGGIDKTMQRLADKDCTIDAGFMDWVLNKHDLTPIGIPVQVYSTSKNVYNTFELQNYRCETATMNIRADRGDYVIDAGGCWGDTALYLANRVSPNGKVYSYEFIPGNLEILKKNLALNPQLSERIEVVENAIWKESGKVVYYNNNGPGSRVGFEKKGESDGTVETLSIDDFVKRNEIPKIDFIKMDIEGAELPALQGAVNTIRRLRPKLAICIYHSMEDFVGVPKFIQSLDVGYELYLRHFSIHAEETVLFASS